MELWVGSNIMIFLFFSLYIAASHTAPVHYIFVCAYIHCWLLYMYYFREHVSFDFFY